VAAESDRLTKFAAELPIGAFQQRGGAEPLGSQASNRVEHEGLLKIALQGSDGLWGLFAPLLCPVSQALASFLFSGFFSPLPSTSLFAVLMFHILHSQNCKAINME
jgi:hypothetical protein